MVFSFGETEEDFQGRLRPCGRLRLITAITLYHSERPGTLAARRYQDDIHFRVKKKGWKVIALAAITKRHLIGRVHPAAILEKALTPPKTEILSGSTFPWKGGGGARYCPRISPVIGFSYAVIDATSATLIAKPLIVRCRVVEQVARRFPDWAGSPADVYRSVAVRWRPEQCRC